MTRSACCLVVWWLVGACGGGSYEVGSTSEEIYGLGDCPPCADGEVCLMQGTASFQGAIIVGASDQPPTCVPVDSGACTASSFEGDCVNMDACEVEVCGSAAVVSCDLETDPPLLFLHCP